MPQIDTGAPQHGPPSEEERGLLGDNPRAGSEEIQAEQARRREQHQSMVLKSLPIALYTASLHESHRHLHFTNDSVRAITGFAPEAFEREDFWISRLHPEDKEGVLTQLQTLRDTGTATLEYRWRCADDLYRHFLDQSVAIRDDDGAAREFFGMWFDITQRKELEQNLLHASKLEAIGRLTRGIAHDFNNMLSVVIGNLDLLQGAIQGNEQAERRVGMAMEGAQRCADLTQRLLAFSRRQALQTAILNVNALMPEVLGLLRRTIGEDIEIRLASAGGVWPIKADRSQLEAALLNLAVNARDAMPAGGHLTLEVENRTIEGHRRVPPGDYVVISVRDTGIGMAPAVLERVFEPFFTTKESGKGTGLGLSMVYGFVQQSNGRVEVESAEGEGTIIRLFLPRADEDAAAAGAFRIAQPIGHGEPVLVVEDDAAVRQVAVSTLQALGFEVKEAPTGDVAADMLKQDGGFRLVLSDVRMPGEITGIDLARMVKREWPSVPVLLTTGYMDGDARLDGLEFIYKPYRAVDLADKIQRLLEQP